MRCRYAGSDARQGHVAPNIESSEPYPSSAARHTFAPNNRCWRRAEMEILGRAPPEAGGVGAGPASGRRGRLTVNGGRSNATKAVGEIIEDRYRGFDKRDRLAYRRQP